MKNRALFSAMAGMGLTFVIGMAVGQNGSPTVTKGVKVSDPTYIDLTNEIANVAGHQLRLRVITLEPGGVVAVHSHNGRPAVAQVLEGVLTEHVENGGVHERRAGESWSEGKEVTHWSENKGSTPTRLIAVDVYKP